MSTTNQTARVLELLKRFNNGEKISIEALSNKLEEEYQTKKSSLDSSFEERVNEANKNLNLELNSSFVNNSSIVTFIFLAFFICLPLVVICYLLLYSVIAFSNSSVFAHKLNNLSSYLFLQVWYNQAHLLLSVLLIFDHSSKSISCVYLL